MPLFVSQESYSIQCWVYRLLKHKPSFLCVCMSVCVCLCAFFNLFFFFTTTLLVRMQEIFSHCTTKSKTFLLVVNLTYPVYRLNCVQKILHTKFYKFQTVQTLKPRDELQRVWQELVYHNDVIQVTEVNHQWIFNHVLIKAKKFALLQKRILVRKYLCQEIFASGNTLKLGNHSHIEHLRKTKSLFIYILNLQCHII